MNDYAKVNINLGEMLFDELIKIMAEEFNDLYGDKDIEMFKKNGKYNERFVEWLNKDRVRTYFAKSVINLYADYDLDSRQQYLLVKKAYFFGISMVYDDKNLLSDNIVQNIDIEFIDKMKSKNDKDNLRIVLQKVKNIDLLKKLYEKKRDSITK